MAQLSLLSLLQGERQTVAPPEPRRAPGRPPKVARVEPAPVRRPDEATHEALSAVRDALRREPLSDAVLRSQAVAGEPGRGARGEVGDGCRMLMDFLGHEQPGELRLPGRQGRSHEGPQFKLSLSQWIERSMEKVRNVSEAPQDDQTAFELVVSAASEQLGREKERLGAPHMEAA